MDIELILFLLGLQEAKNHTSYQLCHIQSLVDRGIVGVERCDSCIGTTQ
jgi:hypothetical protein